MGLVIVYGIGERIEVRHGDFKNGVLLMIHRIGVSLHEDKHYHAN